MLALAITVAIALTFLGIAFFRCWRCSQVDFQEPEVQPLVVPRRPRLVVWITGDPGTGKTSAVKESIFRCYRDNAVNLEDFPLHKVGVRTQLVWHTSSDGRIAVAGAYTFPMTSDVPKHRRGTVPANGGTDTLQPQCRGLLAQLVRGELEACGRVPEVVVLEACARAKVGGPLVMQAMLSAERLVVIQCVTPTVEIAVERLRARDHASDGKNVRGVAPESVHARYAAEVCELREQLTRRAGECHLFAVPEWHEMSADAAMQSLSEMVRTMPGCSGA